MKGYPKDQRVYQVSGVTVAYLYELLKLFNICITKCYNDWFIFLVTSS